MSFTTYETARLLIKPTNIEDAAFILELLNSPKWIEHIGDRKVKTIEDAENYIRQKMLPQLERLGYSNNTIILKETGEKVGVCGLYDREGLEGVDIGFAFLPQFEKKGYARESAEKLIDAAFTAFGISKIAAITTRQNIDSQNLLTKLGFKHSQNIFLPDDPEELRLYSLEKE